MYDCNSHLDPMNHYDLEATATSNAYNLLLLLTGISVATYAFAKFAESQNRLNYESRFARTAAGFLVLMMRMLHTRSDDLEIDSEKKLIAIGPHRTGWEALVVGSKMVGAPPQFLATDYFNFIPGITAFLKMFKAIPVPANKPKEANGRTASNDPVDLASKALETNGCVALFPQGNFSKLGEEPPRIYSGAAKLALKNNVPIHVIRLDGFWCLENSLIPLFIRNSAYYRAFLSLFHMNNVRATLCCEIDFHLKPENAGLTDEKKIEEICAQLYAFYRHTKELSPEQISTVKTEISNKTHLLIWTNKVAQDDLEKKLKQLKNEAATLGETTFKSEGMGLVRA